MAYVAFTVRMDPELKRRLDLRAHLNRRSRNSQMVWMLEESLTRLEEDDLKALALLDRSQSGPQ